MAQYDYVIVGSGVAGLSVALAAAQGGKSSLIITKNLLEESNTRYAQGGIAAAVGKDDSPKFHTQDTLNAGAGLCDPQAVAALTEGAPERIAELVRLGMPFDRAENNNELALGREGAHGVNRILHAGGDATGKFLEHTLVAAIKQSPLVHCMEEYFVTELIKDDSGRVTGVRLANQEGAMTIRANFVVLATGGAGQLYRYTTNPEVTTGDGMALAWRAGALMADMEFFQFHPTALNMPGVQTFLISEALRGDGAKLRNAHGELFMEKYDPRLELASRDIVARAIASELQLTGAVYLDARHMGDETLQHHFPSIYEFCQSSGLDIAREMIPVAPAAHYFMGGILTGRWGETTLPGLFACGEVAANGVHGANRLASNSLLEGLVYGKRLYDYTATGAGTALNLSEYRESSPLPLFVNTVAIQATEQKLPTLEELQKLMWERVGLAREAKGLQAALTQLEGWEAALSAATLKTQADRELHNLVTVGCLVARAALLREESRGAHYRLDFPQINEKWQGRIVLQTEESVSSAPDTRTVASSGVAG